MIPLFVGVFSILFQTRLTDSREKGREGKHVPAEIRRKDLRSTNSISEKKDNTHNNRFKGMLNSRSGS